METRDRVRFVFHQSFKKYKDVEAEAVKAFAASLTDFDVQYAFVHVSDSHNWMLFDRMATGVKFGNCDEGENGSTDEGNASHSARTPHC